MSVEARGMQIRIPQGDTGNVKFVAENGGLAESDRGVFTLASRSGAAILRKVLEPNLGDEAFHLPFVYEDTATLKPDTYEWSFRVVRGGEFDAKGRITDVHGSHTPILKGRLVIQAVAGGAR